VKREFHARFIEKLGVKFPLLTRRSLPENWFLHSERYLIGMKTFDSNYLLEHWSDFLKPIGNNKVYNQIGALYRDIIENVLQGWQICIYVIY